MLVAVERKHIPHDDAVLVLGRRPRFGLRQELDARHRAPQRHGAFVRIAARHRGKWNSGEGGT